MEKHCIFAIRHMLRCAFTCLAGDVCPTSRSLSSTEPCSAGNSAAFKRTLESCWYLTEEWRSAVHGKC